MRFTAAVVLLAGLVSGEQVMADDEVYGLHIKVAGEETVELPKYGKVKCLRLDPTAEFQGIFVRSGKVTMWMTQDPRRICAQRDAEVPVGTVHVTLIRVRGPGDDFWIKQLNSTNAVPARLPDS